ncbi:MAG: HlyC/CorC family transporter [Neomegalonema sp.]|nr:HlyC/CorC family transporter [Neomegalonema sp.]
MDPTIATEAASAGPSALTAWLTALGVLALLLMSAFFSGSETALTAASRPRLRRMADEGSRAAGAALRLTEDSERLIGAILLGNNLVNILAASLATSLLQSFFGASGVAVATLVMTLLVLIFSEVLPKTYAIMMPEAAATRVSRPISLAVQVFSPAVGVVRWIVRGVLSIFGLRPDPKLAVLAREEIRGAIDLHHDEGAVARDARDRLLGALELDDREVNQVMIHRRNILMIDGALPPSEIIDQCLKSPYTRIPLYQDDSENIVGILHARDLLREVDRLMRGPDGSPERLSELDVMSVAMAPWFVPDTTSLANQLRAFLARKSHFALVVDEYGALQGLVTLEDILEEIVGEISDEHDDEVDGVTREGEDVFVVDGGAAIRDLNRLFDWKLPDDEATTIAGLVIHEAQTIPTKGQIFIFHGFRFEILERQRHQITKLRMRKLAPT